MLALLHLALFERTHLGYITEPTREALTKLVPAAQWERALLDMQS